MERQNILDPGSEIHMCALQFVFLPRTDMSLASPQPEKFSNRYSTLKDALESNFTVECVVLTIANAALSVKYWTCKLSPFLIGL